ncbi:MAG: glycosyltransferase family 39 protein [Saprospiraceae bacterium]|nr:glycosyltransferase family 39 protein [Saprospiraceae bacterium]
MKFSKLPIWLYGFFVVLLIPALLINLGLMTFIDDEGIRVLVAMEMDLSGNWITPTLHGEFYYKKPPLFNWILLGWFKVVGKVNEFTARIPTIIALLGYAGTVFYFYRKALGKEFAFVQVIALITCGRILFWDSMLALIDITFSWVVFTQFMVVYFAFAKKRWLQLFVITYVLTAIGFMLKGLPAIVFQGITLLAYFTFRGAFRQLFKWQHIVGGLIFILIVGGYYGIYHQYNDLNNVFQTLFSESSQRTVVNYGIRNTILHVFTFPGEMTYHFLPWSFLIIYVLRWDILEKLKADPFITFNAFIFLVNILIYWTSPEVYPRYLLMFVPLIFSVLFYLHHLHKLENSWQYKGVRLFFWVLVVILTVGWLVIPFMDRLDFIHLKNMKAILLGVLVVVIVSIFHRKDWNRFVLIGFLLLVFRIGFNFFVLPDRNANDFGDLCRQSSLAIGQKYQDKPMYVWQFETEMQMTNSTYLTDMRQSIIPVATKPAEEESVYIIDPDSFPELSYTVVDSIYVRHGRKTYHIASFTNSDND